MITRSDMPAARARSALQRRELLQNLVVVGEAPFLLLREDRTAVDTNIEDAARSLDQLRLDVKVLLDGGRQTGGAWEVVSNPAVFDRNLHWIFISLAGSVRPQTETGSSGASSQKRM